MGRPHFNGVSSAGRVCEQRARVGLRGMHSLPAHGVRCFLSNCQKHWSPLLPQHGVFSHYLKIVVFVNWDKHLVGRTFTSWSFQFEFCDFSCLPGVGKKDFLNTATSSGFPDRGAPSENSTCAARSICPQY